MSRAAPAVAALFVDTGAFYAVFDEDDEEHERARAVLNGIRSGDLPYRPIYTSAYVVSELTTLLNRKAGHGRAVAALETVRESPNVTIVHPDETVFDDVCREFARYDDRQISFVDHVTGVQARDRDVDYVFTFDVDDFRTLGFTCVPADTGDV